jgi:hypothetical protein
LWRCRRPSSLFVWAVVAATLRGQNPVELPPVNLDVPLIRQKTEVWCWLAVTEMAIQYRNRGAAPRQCEMIAAGLETSPSVCCTQPQKCARAGTMREIRFALATFGKVSSEFSPPVNFGVLYRAIKDGYPVIISYVTGPDSAHVVIARGMKFLIQGDRITPLVLVNDPLEPRPVWVPYKQLRANWISSIAIGPPDLDR